MKKFVAYAVSLYGEVKYIGVTTRGIVWRWQQHKYASGTEPTRLARAIRKHGFRAFKVEHIASAWDHSSLCDLEKILISQFNTMSPNGYNLTSGGNQNFVVADDTRARISASKIGKVTPSSVRQKISASKLGIKHTEQSRKNMSAGRMGLKQTPETVAKRAATMAAIFKDETYRRNVSLSLKGKPKTLRHRLSIAAAARNRSRKINDDRQPELTT